jgi:EmrB/QacA subfamily drug resistance transporter
MTAQLTRPTAATRLGLVLAACCLGQFMVVLDASVVNVALPSIAAELHFEVHNLQWVNNAYAIAFAGFLMLGGRLADLLGQRRIFLAGVGLFTLASSVGGLAGDPVTLVLARAFQGLGSAVMAPATLTVLSTTFTDPGARARAFGLWSAVSGAAGAIGVLLGGVITEWFSWRWILLINVPIGVVLLAGVWWAVPETRGRRQKLDVPGALLVTAGLLALVSGISGKTPYAALAGVVLLGIFLVHQAKFAAQPLVPLGIFRTRSVWSANLVAFFAISALFSTFYFFTLILQQVLGYSPLQTGLSYLPLSAGIAIGGWRVSSVVPRTGPRPIVLTGLALSCAGLLWLSTVDEHATFAGHLLGPALLLGAGMGMVLNATTNAATSGLPREQAGLASGLLNTTRQLGSALGLVTLATISATRIDAEGGLGTHALVSGYGLAVFGAAVFTAAGFAAAVMVPRSRTARGAGETLNT